MLLCSMQLHALTTKGNQIVDATGTSVHFNGINVFGFQNTDTMIDGLWTGPNSLTFDFATMVYRMQLLGFNAVRLPFSFQDLFTLTPRIWTKSCTPPTQSQIQASVTDPSVPVPTGVTIPPMIAPPLRTPGLCNDYFPNDTTLNRFLWVVNFFAKNGFYVLIDNHFREDQTVLTQGTAQWVQDWVRLVTLICQDPISKSKLLVDLLNEPDNHGLLWEATATLPALKDLYLSAMDALYPINPDMLFLIEGTGQKRISTNWGDGFATDPALIAQYGLSDPNPFFQTLLQKPYLNQVVISPHVYPPSVTTSTTNFSGPGLWNRLSASFGYLTQTGYCNGSSPCKIFPVAIGEFGSQFVQANDLLMLSDFASYLNNTAAAADGKHQAISSWFYWCWNANSPDTGGILDSNWLNILWPKIEYLSASLGLTPWYQNPPPVNPVPTPPPVSPPISLSVSAHMGTPWQSGGVYQNTVNLYITNTSSQSINVPWSITIGNSSYLSAIKAWNMAIQSFSGGVVSSIVSNSWQVLRPNGANTVNVGMTVSSSITDFAPTAVTINGVSYPITIK